MTASDLETASCIDGRVQCTPEPSARELAVVIDATMRNPAPGTDWSRWGVTSWALEHGVDRLHEDVQVGAVFGPNLGSDGVLPSVDPQDLAACLDPQSRFPLGALGPWDSARRREFGSLLSSLEPSPGRPLEDAFAAAFAAIAGAAGDRLILLVTDGAPSLAAGCTDPAGDLSPVAMIPLIDAIGAAAAAGVRTAVVGLPGSSGVRTALSRAAVAGGTAPAGCDSEGTPPCHFDLSAEADLSSALAAVLHVALGPDRGPPACELDFADAPTFTQLILDPLTWIVIVEWPDGSVTSLPLDPDGSRGDGWTPDGTTIRLGETACATVRATEPPAAWFAHVPCSNQITR